MNIKKFVISSLLTLALAACSSHRTTLPYFTDIADVKTGILEQVEYNTTIAPDDELLITVLSSIPEATAAYNLPLSNPATRADMMLSTTPKQQTYIVNSKGDITMPILGEIHVAGLTTEQLQKELTDRVRMDVKDAMVRVELINFQVVVAGEVARPSTVTVHRNKYSILDAISAAGDLTQYGERSNVLLIRDNNGKREFVHLDLNSSDVLTSPYFYVKQNDYIYVEPNEIRQDNSRYNQDNAFKLQVISTVVSAASVIASLVIALAVK